MIIEESDMRFGDYPDEMVFYIERSSQYTNQLMPNGVKICEFILKRANTICFVEAKKTCPKQITAESPEEKKKKYQEYIADITDKMRHALSLYANILLKRYESEQVPQKLLQNDLSGQEIKLILVVKNAQTDWLIPLRDVLDRELKKDSRIWRCSQFYVINEEKAREKHFVI